MFALKRENDRLHNGLDLPKSATVELTVINSIYI